MRSPARSFMSLFDPNMIAPVGQAFTQAEFKTDADAIRA